MPQEFPLKPNEKPPTIGRRMRTEFTFSDRLLMKPKTKDEEKLSKLELDFQIQCNIVKATCKLCNLTNTKKSVRKQRRQMYQQAVAKLKDLEKNLQTTKQQIAEMRRTADSARMSQASLEDTCHELKGSYRGGQRNRIDSLIDQENQGSSLSLNELHSGRDAAGPINLEEMNKHHRRWLTGHLHTDSNSGQLPSSISAPSTPVKNRSAKLMAAAAAAAANAETCSSFIAANGNNFNATRFSPVCFDSRIALSPSLNRQSWQDSRGDLVFRRPGSALPSDYPTRNFVNRVANASRCGNSPEYDTISSNASSLGSQPNLLRFRQDSYQRLLQHGGNEYEQLNEHSPEAEAKQFFGVPTRRSAIALHCSQDDLNVNPNLQDRERFIMDFGGAVGRTISESDADHLTRHNSLENPRRKSYLTATQSAVAITPVTNSNSRFGLINRQSSGNLVAETTSACATKPIKQSLGSHIQQRPLPPPPIEAAFQPPQHLGSSSSSMPTSGLTSTNSQNNSSYFPSGSSLSSNMNQILRRKNKPYPPPLNLSHHQLPLSNSSIPSQLPPQPISLHGQPSSSSSSTIAQLMSQPKSAGMCRLQPQPALPSKQLVTPQHSFGSQMSTPAINSPTVFDEPTINCITDQILMGLQPVRSSVVRTPLNMGNTCPNDYPSQANAPTSPAPSLPPRTPINGTTIHSNRSSSAFFACNGTHTAYLNGLHHHNNSEHQHHHHHHLHQQQQQQNHPYHSHYNPINGQSFSSSQSIDSSVLNSISSSLNSIHSNVSSQSNLQQSVFNLLTSNHSGLLLNQIKNELAEKKQLQQQTSTSRSKGWIETSIDGDEQLSTTPCFKKPTFTGTKTGSLSENGDDHSTIADGFLAKSLQQLAPPALIKSSSRPSSTASVSTSTVQKVLQPFREEVKPYELSDFYKYSQKHRKKPLENPSTSNSRDGQPARSISDTSGPPNLANSSSQPAVSSTANSSHTLIDNLANQVNGISLTENRSEDSFEARESESNMNYTLNEASFMIKTQVAEAFSDEMNAWYEEKYKTATLV